MPSSAPITCRCRAMAPAAADGARRRAAGRRTRLRERSPQPRLGSTSPPSNPTEMSMTTTPNPAKVSVSWEEFAPGCQGSRKRDHSHQASRGCWRWRRLAGGGRSHRYRPHRQGAHLREAPRPGAGHTYVTEVSQDTWIYFPWENGQMESMITQRTDR